MGHQLKEKLVNELRRYMVYTIFLLILFVAFTSYNRMLLKQYNGYLFTYGYCLIKALIMAKVIMIGEVFNMGEKYSSRPLIIPVIYKTCVFCIFMLILTIAEHAITGYFEHQTIYAIYQKYIYNKFILDLAQIEIMFFIFIFFFSVLETSNALGGNKLFKMFFKSRWE